MVRVRRAARWLVRVLVSAAIVGYVVADVDLGDVAHALAHVRLVQLLPATRRTRELRREVEVDLSPLWRDRRLLGTVALVSVVFHLAQVGAQYVLARAAGATLPFSYCLIFHPAIGVMTALPVSVNGLGVREGGYLYFLTRLDVDDSIAVALSLLAFGVTVFGGLLGGLVFLASGATLPTLRAPASKEAGVAA